MSFTHVVIRESSARVRGPQKTLLSTHDSEAAAMDAANTALVTSPDTFYVCAVVATTTKVVQMTRVAPVSRPGLTHVPQLCWGCQHSSSDHPNDSGCNTFHTGPDR